jgi:hypothetical protein
MSMLPCREFHEPSIASHLVIASRDGFCFDGGYGASIVSGEHVQLGGHAVNEPTFQNSRICIEINQYSSVFWGIIAMEFRVDFCR